MEAVEFLKDYPGIGTIAIGATFTAIGFFAQFFVNIFIEKSKKKLEFQEFLWKEKIQAAKKASEYIFLHVELLRLSSEQYEILENSNGNDTELLVIKMQDLIDHYIKRLLGFPHFEYYHVNLFFDLENLETDKILKQNYNSLNNIANIPFNDGDPTNQNKITLLKTNLKVLKESYQRVLEIYHEYLKIIKKDITTLPK